MKLITYLDSSKSHCGILVSSGIIDIKSAWPGSGAPSSVKEILERGPECLSILAAASKNRNIIPLNTVKLLAPVQGPGKIIALAGNYSEHIKEAGLALGLSESPHNSIVPRPFLIPSTSVIGTNEQIPWPVYSDKIDYELELAVVIGKKAKCLTTEQTGNIIAGYTIANDASARSVTFAKQRTKRPWDEFYDWLTGKWADGFMPMGPYLLTADEIGDVQDLEMTLSVNGEIRQKANTSEMIFSVVETISFLSHIMTLEPGDVISTGTPSGVAMTTGRFLQPGDRIECTIEKLGTLRNTMGPKPEKFYQPLVNGNQ